MDFFSRLANTEGSTKASISRLFLYTKHEGSTLLVARISNIYVPKLEELKKAFKKMTKTWMGKSNAKGCKEYLW